MTAPISQEKIREFQLETEAAKRASADPLPGPLANAFLCQDIEVEGYRVRPIVAYDWAVMKKLNSPIYRQMLEVMQLGDKAENVETEPQDAWDLAFLLTRPCEEADKHLKKGVEAFREDSKKEFGFKLNLGQIMLLNGACLRQVQAHMETMVKYGSKETEGNGEVRNFPAAEAKPATVLAGG